MAHIDDDDNFKRTIAPMHLDENSLATDRITEKTESSSYKPAVMTDEHRLKKIKQALPAIRTLFEKEFNTNHFPAFVYGIVVDGELFSSDSFGYIDLEKQRAATSKSLFRIASMTKSFIAMGIIKLRDENMLRLDDPVDQYISEFKATDLLTSDAPIITIRHLLTHTSGMPEDDPWADRQMSITDAHFLTILRKGISLSYPPGVTWEYSNVGFSMLGRIITVITKIPYQEYIKQEILDPLGMVHTFWEYADAPPELLARGYRWECEKYSEEPYLHDGVFSGMAGIITSVEDFSKYVSYHLQAWPPRTEPEYGPVRRSSLREMQYPSSFVELVSYKHRSCPITRAYGYGLNWIKDYDGIVSINHTGCLPGFGSNWIILPEHGVGLIAFANHTYAQLESINYKIMNEILILADLKRRQLSMPNMIAERKQQIIALLLHDNWNITENSVSSIFSENFFLDKSLGHRKMVSQELLSRAGKILSIGDTILKNQLRGYFCMQGVNMKIKVEFSFSPENPPLMQELILSEFKEEI